MLELRIFFGLATEYILVRRLVALLSYYMAATRIAKTEIYKPRKNTGRSTRIMAKRTYRQSREVEEKYFRNHPEEIDAYLDEIFDKYVGRS